MLPEKSKKQEFTCVAQTRHNIMSTLIDTLFSIGLFVPLTTLSVRIFLDAIQFAQFVAKRVKRIQTIQHMQHYLLEQSPYNEKQGMELTHANNNVYLVSKENSAYKIVLLCQRVLQLWQGSKGSVRYATLVFEDDKPLALLG